MQLHRSQFQALNWPNVTSMFVNRYLHYRQVCKALYHHNHFSCKHFFLTICWRKYSPAQSFRISSNFHQQSLWPCRLSFQVIFCVILQHNKYWKVWLNTGFNLGLNEFDLGEIPHRHTCTIVLPYLRTVVTQHILGHISFALLQTMLGTHNKISRDFSNFTQRHRKNILDWRSKWEMLKG